MKKLLIFMLLITAICFISVNSVDAKSKFRLVGNDTQETDNFKPRATTTHVGLALLEQKYDATEPITTTEEVVTEEVIAEDYPEDPDYVYDICEIDEYASRENVDPYYLSELEGETHFAVEFKLCGFYVSQVNTHVTLDQNFEWHTNGETLYISLDWIRAEFENTPDRDVLIFAYVLSNEEIGRYIIGYLFVHR